MRSLTPDLIGRRAAVPSLLDKKGISRPRVSPEGRAHVDNCSARLSSSTRSNAAWPKPRDVLLGVCRRPSFSSAIPDRGEDDSAPMSGSPGVWTNVRLIPDGLLGRVHNCKGNARGRDQRGRDGASRRCSRWPDPLTI